MYEDIISFPSLLAAYYKARRSKRYNETILGFNLFLESKLFKMHQELQNDYYRPSPYVYFTVIDPKERKVAAPAFRDRVLQHTLVSHIEPLFEKSFIYDSYACRVGKGTHFGLKRVKTFLQAARSIHGKDVPIYCLRLDISKFFGSISWDILLSLIFKKITCPQTRKLIETIVTHYQFFDHTGKPLTPPPYVISLYHKRGLPIGNLTSQLFANVYLNVLDHFIKDTLHVRWYARYMDDFLIIHHDKAYLIELKEVIQQFLAEKLQLTLSEKKVILANVKNGIPFVGYRIFYDHILVRGKTLLHMQRKLQMRKAMYEAGDLTTDKLQASLGSFRGHLKYADSWILKKRMLLDRSLD